MGWQADGGDQGQSSYHPAMMTGRLPHVYCQGVYASRQIAAACEQGAGFMAVTGMARADFRTIGDFRKHQQLALEGNPARSVPSRTRLLGRAPRRKRHGKVSLIATSPIPEGTNTCVKRGSRRSRCR